MTPGISVARKAKITHKVHEYSHDPSSESYGLEAAEKLGVPEAKVFKTLVVNLDNKELAVGVIPVSSLLSMKRIAKAAGAKKATMAAPSDVERSTGYVLGGVSPLGQKKRLKTILDLSVLDHSTIFVSAGRRGLEIELQPSDLVEQVAGVLAELCHQPH
ncbi:MAG: Cys-tRNA(Pro) deacylase [Pseudomonadota bacterium]